MAEPRVELKGSYRQAPFDAEVVGTPPPGETVYVTIVVRRRSPLPAPDPGSPLSREEVAEKYGADPRDLKKAADFAAEHGLAVVETDAVRRTVHVSGSIAAMEECFGTELKLYRQGDRTFRGRSGPLLIPANLEGIIEGVFGLDQRQQARTREA